MGFFYGLDAEAYDRQYSDKQLVGRIGRYFEPRKRMVIIVGMLTAGLSIVGAAQPFVIARGLDLLVADRKRWDVLIGLALFMLVFGLLNWSGNWLRRRLTAKVIGDVVTDLRTDVFRAVMNHDMSFFDEFRSGRIISRITSDTEEFYQVVQLITDLIGQVLLLVILLIALLTVSWQLTLMLVVLAPFVFLFSWAFRRIARRVTRRGFRVLAEVNAAIQEAVTGISVAKNFRQEGNIYNEFTQVNLQSYRVNLLRGYTLAAVFPVLNMLSGLGTAILVYWGGLYVIGGSISIGSWYLFIISVDRFWFPMINISAFWSQVQGGLSASERIFALIDATLTVHQLAERPVKALRGAIDFNNVSFRYSERVQVLDGFDLHIAPGESIALVGHTGAGKSSIAKLIARFYEFQGGSILADGQDIRTFALQDYRRYLGMVSQMPFLFSGTVADNIRYARPDLTDAEIETVARRIGGGAWFDVMPRGLHTDVGERGARLSMGQRQLVALMRVLVRDVSIFILDEATASVDPFTEMQIQEAMNLILRHTTSIVIAHRLSTVRSVDRIIVLQKGRIIEEGNHDALIAQGGHYAELYDTYFRHQSLAYIEEVGQRRRAR